MKISSIIILIFLVSCKEAEKPKFNLNGVIKSAKVLSFTDLSDQQKEELKYCCNYYPSNWRDGVGFKKEDAYFVKTTIDNILLAELSETDAFPKKELLSYNEKFLYGKYHNRWGFISENNDTIYETEKFEGHRIIEIIRTKNIDEIIVGPLPNKPKKMFISIWGSKNYPDLTPEFDIKE